MEVDLNEKNEDANFFGMWLRYGDKKEQKMGDCHVALDTYEIANFAILKSGIVTRLQVRK